MNQPNFRPTLFFSALALLGTSAAYANAGSIALNCDRSPQDQTRILHVAKNQYVITHAETETSGLTNKPFTISKQFDLTVLGNSPAGAEAELVSPRQTGQSYVTISTKADAKGTYSGYFNDGFGGGGLTCKPDAAFAELTSDLQGAPTIEKETYQDYQDSMLAARCTTDTSETFKIRAIKDSFAMVDTQVISSTDENGFGADLDAFVQTPTGIEATISSGSMQYPPVASDSSLVVTKKAGKDGKIAMVYSDGKTTKNLSCTTYWAYNNFWKAIKEQNMKAKALPAPGTTQEVNLNLTADQVQHIADLYSDLIMKIPGVNGTGESVYRKEDPKSPYGNKQDVWYLDIMVEKQEQLAGVKAALGDSLEGALVQYEVVGEIVAQ